MGDITHLFDLVRRNDRATTELSCVPGVLIDVPIQMRFSEC